TEGHFKFFDEGKIAVMKIHGFPGLPDRKKALEEFYRESFGAMNSKGTKTLILDLRDHGGGLDGLGMLLLSYLLDKPFKYYDDLVINALEFSFQKPTGDPIFRPSDKVERQSNGKYRWVGHLNLGMRQPSAPTFTGKVLILMNGGSFSSAAQFV